MNNELKTLVIKCPHCLGYGHEPSTRGDIKPCLVCKGKKVIKDEK